jgi:putative ABC transport system permease protein
MPTFSGYLRQGGRALFKQRAISLIAVLGLALGIGITTTMFSIVNGIVLRGLPFPHSERLMYLDRHEVSGVVGQLRVTPHDYVDWRAQQRSFTDLAAFTRDSFNLSGPGGPPERHDGSLITAGMFRLLGVGPELGRGFTEADAANGAEPVALLSRTLWVKRFGGDPGIVGRTIRVNSAPVRVVGVMPQGFEFPVFQSVWMPLHLDPLPVKRGDGPNLEVIGMLKPGVSRQQALTEMEGIAKRLEMAYPANKHILPMVRPYIAVMLSEEAIALLYTMLGASLGVLMIACANVANLLLARAAVRSREVAIRASMGASRQQIILQFVFEAFLLAVMGGLAGLMLAGLAGNAFNRALTGLSIPFWVHVGIDLPVLAVVFGLMLLASVLSGVVPAVKASGADLSLLLKDQTRGTSSMRIGKLSRVLVVVEVALSCGLLVASGLMIKSIFNLRALHYAFETRGILAAEVSLPPADYPDDGRRLRFFEELERRLGDRPGVTRAALTSALPAVGVVFKNFAYEGRAYPQEKDYPYAGVVTVSPAIFAAFGVRALDGRLLTAADNATAQPVAVVNQAFVRRFGGADPRPETLLGKRVRVGRGDSKEPWMTIVGVVPDMLVGTIRSPSQQGIYMPLAQHPQATMDIVLRAAQADSTASLAGAVRETVASLDRNLPVDAIKPMPRVISDNNWFYGVFGSLFMAFGLMALVLASIGLYGVMSFAVSRRTHEIGTRMALGAQGGAVMGLVLRQGMTQVVAGLVLGLGFALGLSQLLQVLLVGVRPWDLAVFTLVVAALSGTAFLACYLPARSALRVSPVTALRSE